MAWVRLAVSALAALGFVALVVVQQPFRTLELPDGFEIYFRAGEAPRWPERQRDLEQTLGSLHAIGRIPSEFGGFDVYEKGRGDEWAAVGHDGATVVSKPGWAMIGRTDEITWNYRRRLSPGESSEPRPVGSHQLAEAAPR